MLVLILGDNLPLLFVGWEGVGLCSYLLIGFWYESAAERGGGQEGVHRQPHRRLRPALRDVPPRPLHAARSTGTGSPTARPAWCTRASRGACTCGRSAAGSTRASCTSCSRTQPFTVSAATAVGLALLLGCTGKSAQIPLYVWLPDAMAGPTPVSALIHAATMVTAGVYLICRLSFVFVLSPFTMMVIAIVGAATALFAATIALVQNDIKKVLAYSTVSQLGFMFLGVGVGAFTAGFFHVFTHAFFKACLFLGAGSVIHAMHARIHDDDKAQDMRNMGGLRKWLPLTHCDASRRRRPPSSACPFTSGFFSKDEILYRAFVDHTVNPDDGTGLLHEAAHSTRRRSGSARSSTWWPSLAATLTAFYMCRLYFLTFWGDFKGWTVGRPSLLAQAGAGARTARRARRPPRRRPLDPGLPAARVALADDRAAHHPGDVLALRGRPQPGLRHPQGAARSTTGSSRCSRRRPRARSSSGTATTPRGPSTWSGRSRSAASAPSSSAPASRTGCTSREKGEPAQRLAAALPGLYQLLLDKWRVDELYDATVIRWSTRSPTRAPALDKRRRSTGSSRASRRWSSRPRARSSARSRTASCTSTRR